MELSLLEFHKQVRQFMDDNGIRKDATLVSGAQIISGSWGEGDFKIRTTIFRDAGVILEAFEGKNFEQVLHKVKCFFENRELESPISDVLVDVDTILSPESVVDNVELL